MYATLESLLLIHLKTSLNVGNLEVIVQKSDIDIVKAHKGVYDLCFPLNLNMIAIASDQDKHGETVTENTFGQLAIKSVAVGLSCSSVMFADIARIWYSESKFGILKYL